MADQSDVANVLVQLVIGCVYPNGTGQSPVGGQATKAFAGWPTLAALRADFTAGLVDVSVYPRTEERSTSHLVSGSKPIGPNAPGAVIAVNGSAVTFSGTPTPGEVIYVTDGGANYYLYAVAAGDTPQSIAAAIAAGVSGASASGATLTVPWTPKSATVNPQWTALREVKRQDKLFQITVWSADPAKRDTVAKLLDAALADNYRLALPDGSSGTSRSGGGQPDDDSQKSGIYRRDILRWVEYPTTVIETLTPVLKPLITVSQC